MSRYAIVGPYDCPRFAKAVKLSEKIVAANPGVDFHREMLDRFHWAEYCIKMKQQRGWDIKRSPVVFHVLMDSDRKAVLIGDCNDFCEYAAMYYDIYYDPTTAALQAMVLSNKARYGHGFEGQDRGDTIIFTIAIVSAPIEMLELLLTQLLSPMSITPRGVVLNIHVFDDFTESKVLQGLFMEAFDMGSPKLFKITLSSSLATCLYHCHLLIVAEDFSRRVTEEERDWITRVEDRVTGLISTFNDRRTRTPNCRVIVGGDGPQCYVAEMMRKAISEGNIGPGRLVASGQYIVQRAKSELGRVGNVPAGCVARIHAWGWPGETGAYVEVRNAVLRGAEVAVRGPGVEVPLAEVATECDYIFKNFSKDFIKLQIEDLKLISTQPKRHMSLVESIINTIHIWLSTEQIVPHTTKKSDLANVPEVPISIPQPVLNVGVPCASGSTFPEGTFMVQPATCIDGRWQAAGKISDMTHEAMLQEVNKLWLKREKLIYRDKNNTLFPDHEELIGTGTIRHVRVKKERVKEMAEETEEEEEMKEEEYYNPMDDMEEDAGTEEIPGEGFHDAYAWMNPTHDP